MFEILRSIYRRLRSLPVIGSLVVGLRQGVFPRFMTNKQRYEQQQAILEAHSAALAGLKQAMGNAEREFGKVYQAVEGSNGRLEFIRQELFYELRHLTSGSEAGVGGASGAAMKIEPQIVDEARVRAAREKGDIRLNVGCGHKPEPDRINVDMRPLPGVEVVATVDDLPFEEGEVGEIYSAHVMEHFPQETMQRTIMPHWVGLLKSGGELRAIVPDIEAMIAGYNDGSIDFETLRLITYGGQEYEGDFHHTMFTPESLKVIFEQAGLVDVEIADRGRRNGLCFECEVVGRKA